MVDERSAIETRIEMIELVEPTAPDLDVARAVQCRI